MYKKIARMAIPIAFQNLINIGVNAMDTFMIGGISQWQLSGVAIAAQPFFIFNLFFFGLASGGCVLTSQFFGKKDKEAIKTIASFMMKLIMVIAVIFIVILEIWGRPVLSLFTSDPKILTYGVAYMQIQCLTYIFIGYTAVYLILLRSLGNVTTSLKIYGSSLVMNICLNSILIYGLFGMPRLEIIGAAIATLISRIFESILVTYYMHHCDDLPMQLSDFSRSAKPYYGRLIRYTLPVLLSDSTWGLGATIAMSYIGHISSSALAAFSLVITLQDLTGVAIMGVGNAAGIMTGQFIGSGRLDEVKELSRHLLRMALVIGCVIVGILLVIRPFAPYMINSTQQTATILQNMIFVTAYYMFFEAIEAVMMMGILRGAGDTKFCARVDMSVFWIIRVFLAGFATYVLGANAIIVYAILSSDELARVIFGYRRYRSDQWIHETTLSTEGEQV